MIIRRYWMALFVISCTVSACLLLQYFRVSSEIAKVNSVDIKQAAITNRTTGLDRNSVRNLKSVDDNTSPSGNFSNFIYMTQTESCLGPYLLRPDIFGNGCKNDVLVLSWEKPCAQNLTYLKHIKYIYKANSSWSEGRNILYRFAKEIPQNYLYYIFMDDDMTFQFTNSAFRKRYRDLGCSSPLQAFEDFLLKHEPAIGVPLFCSGRGRCDNMKRLKPMPEYLPVTIWFDAAVTAFHRNALDLMLPYRLDYEKKSWYQSQKFVILGAYLMFRGQVLRFAPLSATNNAHREYPRWNSDNWAHIYNILKEEMPKEFKDQVDWSWKPTKRNIKTLPVVQNDTVITPMWKMKIPVGKMTVEPYKHLKNSNS